jgi:hypothetical protein
MGIKQHSFLFYPFLQLVYFFSFCLLFLRFLSVFLFTFLSIELYFFLLFSVLPFLSIFFSLRLILFPVLYDSCPISLVLYASFFNCSCLHIFCFFLLSSFFFQTSFSLSPFISNISLLVTFLPFSLFLSFFNPSLIFFIRFFPVLHSLNLFLSFFHYFLSSPFPSYFLRSFLLLFQHYFLPSLQCSLLLSVLPCVISGQGSEPHLLISFTHCGPTLRNLWQGS